MFSPEASVLRMRTAGGLSPEAANLGTRAWRIPTPKSRPCGSQGSRAALRKKWVAFPRWIRGRRRPWPTIAAPALPFFARRHEVEKLCKSGQ